MEVKKIDKKRGEMTFKRLFIMVGLSILLIIMIIGTGLPGGCNRKQSVVPAPPVVEEEEEKKEDPSARLAAAEKISGYHHPEALISIYELNQRIYDPGIFILDTRGRSFVVFQSSYPLGHILGAVPIQHENYSHPAYFDRIASPLHLQNHLGGLGVSNDSTIVLYGNDGLQARLYWALKMYGHDNLKILDGGFEKWKEAGNDITSASSARRPETFEFDLTRSNTESVLATVNDVEAAIGNPNYIIVDVRSEGEFFSGHIPGSLNIIWSNLQNNDQTFKPAPDLKALFEENKITPDKKIIVYSSSGIRSSLAWFTLSELLGYPNVKNYDGSYEDWTKLGRRVEKGGIKQKP
jgi:thiosulfate/3-mercaptopyruvate sulfurtransferase